MDRLVFGAGTLAERLARSAGAGDVGAELAGEALLERWASTAAGGDPDLFQRRLTWDGLDVPGVWRALCGKPADAGSEPSPPWLPTLLDVMKAAGAGSRAETPPPLDSERPLPYEDVLVPAVLAARRRLRSRLARLPAAAGAVLGPGALRALERALLERLTGLAARAIHAEHIRAIPPLRRLRSRVLGARDAAGSREHYDALVSSWAAEGLAPLFSRYPVLARLLATAVDQWVESTQELLVRVAGDLPALREAFSLGTGTAGEAPVVAVLPHLSDFHRGGRAVAVLTFASGAKVVYKPKSMELDRAFEELVAWLNARGAPSPLTTPRVLAREGYGYAAFVAHAPCADEDAAARLYERAGMLLALVYALGGTDCHRENLVAAGDQLVLVDLETLMHPDARPMAEDEADLATDAAEVLAGDLRDSILRTGLLPRWQADADGDVFDVGGLGTVAGTTTLTELRWEGTNTDDMHRVPATVTVGPDAATAILRGVPLCAKQYLDRIAGGFERMYRLLASHREALLDPSGPLDALRGLPVRFIFRPTQVYSSLQLRATEPDALRDGARRGIELDALAGGYLSSATRPLAWAILREEVEAMERLDVPLFVVRSDDDGLPLGPETVLERYFEAPSHRRMVEQFMRLGEDDLRRQLGILRLAFHGAAADDEPAGTPPPRARVATPGRAGTTPPSPAPGALVDGALVLAERICRSAARGRDGSAAWTGLGYDAATRRFQLQPLGLGLYDGAAGIALFLAALVKVTGDQSHRPLALGALEQVRRVLRHSDRADAAAVIRRLGIGGVTGMGSVVYALVRCGILLDEPSLLDDAARATAFLHPVRIAADEEFDVMGGAAGALLGLLAFHATTGEGLDQAVACGRRLTEGRTSPDGGPAAWRTMGGRHLAGFAHGAAGIAHALLRLHRVTGDPALRAAALEGLEWERRLAPTDDGGWPDLRRPGEPRGSVSWCNGAAGIALARAAAKGLGADEGGDQDLRRAVKIIKRAAWTSADHLCCGTAGQVEALLVAGRQGGLAGCQSLAEEGAGMLLVWCRSAAGLGLMPQPAGDAAPGTDRTADPGLFRGTAGIGYQLLRMARPDLIPSVLLLD